MLQVRFPIINYPTSRSHILVFINLLGQPVIKYFVTNWLSNCQDYWSDSREVTKYFCALTLHWQCSEWFPGVSPAASARPPPAWSSSTASRSPPSPPSSQAPRPPSSAPPPSCHPLPALWQSRHCHIGSRDNEDFEDVSLLRRGVTSSWGRRHLTIATTGKSRRARRGEKRSGQRLAGQDTHTARKSWAGATYTLHSRPVIVSRTSSRIYLGRGRGVSLQKHNQHKE